MLQINQEMNIKLNKIQEYDLLCMVCEYLGVCNKSASLNPDGNVYMPPCSDGEGYESGIFNDDEINKVYQEIINGDYD